MSLFNEIVKGDAGIQVGIIPFHSQQGSVWSWYK